MSDDGTDFQTALRQYTDDVLDDLAHGRPNRYGEIEADFGSGFVRGRLTDTNNEPVIFTWPAAWTWCIDCWGIFRDGEIIHPHHIESDVIQARCIPCFKTHLRKAAQGLAYGFREVNFAAEVAKLGRPADIFDALNRHFESEPVSADEYRDALRGFSDTVKVAECFRCGETIVYEQMIGSECQREGCDGRYIRC